MALDKTHTENAAAAARAFDSHWHVQGRRDAIEGRPMHEGRAKAFSEYARGYMGAIAEMAGAR